MHVDFLWNDTYVRVLNLYASNNIDERSFFWDFISPFLNYHGPVVCVGDFNEVLHP